MPRKNWAFRRWLRHLALFAAHVPGTLRAKSAFFLASDNNKIKFRVQNLKYTIISNRYIRSCDCLDYILAMQNESSTFVMSCGNAVRIDSEFKGQKFYKIIIMDNDTNDYAIIKNVLILADWQKFTNPVKWNL